MAFKNDHTFYRFARILAKILCGPQVVAVRKRRQQWTTGGRASRLEFLKRKKLGNLKMVN
jgi:hypothetical protein